MKRYLWLVPVAAGCLAAYYRLPDLSYPQLAMGVLLQLMAGAVMISFCLYIAPVPLWAHARLIGKTLAWQRRIPTWLFLLGGFLFVAVLCATLSGLLFHHVPHVNDSINQYIHAKFVAAGHIAIDSHPLREFFDSGWMINDGKWYSPYSPGHILLLAVGHLLNLPWLVNPMLGALTVLAVHALARDLYGDATARLAAFFTCFCPLMIFMASGFMNHTTALLFTTLFILYFLRTLHDKHWRDAALAAASLGVLALIRPLTAVAIALPYAVLGLYRIVTQFRAHITPFMIMALVLCLGALFQCWWNLHTTGDPFTFGYYRLFGKDGMPGLGKNTWSESYTLLDGLAVAAERLVTMNETLFEWPVPAMVFIVMLFISGVTRRQDWLLLATYGSVVGVYMFFHGHHEVFGPRYHFESISALIVLTAAGITRLPVILRRVFGLRHVKHAALGMCAILVAVFYMLSLPNLAFRYRLYGSNYYEGNYDYYHNIVKSVRKPALVFVHDDKLPYLYVAFTLPPADDSPVIFARDKGKHNTKLVAYYPCRYAYIYKENAGLLQVNAPVANCR